MDSNDLTRLLTKPTGITAFEVIDKLTEEGTRRLVVERLNPELRPTLADPRCHLFFDVAGFVNYLRKYGSQQTVIFADHEKLEITAELDDFCREEGGMEFATFIPRPHPLWSPWEQAVGSRMPLRTLVEFLRENRKAIVKPDARDLLLVLSQVVMSRNIEMHAGTGRDCLNGLVVHTKIQGRDSSEVVSLPDSITIRVPIYVGLQPIEIEIDLLLSGERDNTVHAKLCAADVNAAKITAFDNAVAQVGTMLQTMLQAIEGPPESNLEYVMALGRPRRGEWTREQA